MNYFTSLAKLNSSGADATRVATVARHLKKLNPLWNDNWLFPISAIGQSNSAADVEWVYYSSLACVATSSKLVVPGAVRGYSSLTLADLTKLLEDAGVETCASLEMKSKTIWVTNNINKINEVLKTLNSPVLYWSQGLAYVADCLVTSHALAKPADKVDVPMTEASKVEIVKEWFDLMDESQKAEIRGHVMLTESKENEAPAS